jgi:hypothetical protein
MKRRNDIFGFSLFHYTRGGEREPFFARLREGFFLNLSSFQKTIGVFFFNTKLQATLFFRMKGTEWRNGIPSRTPAKKKKDKKKTHIGYLHASAELPNRMKDCRLSAADGFD